MFNENLCKGKKEMDDIAAFSRLHLANQNDEFE